MEIEFLSTIAVITPDPPASRGLYAGALGLPFEGAGDSGYHHSDQIPGCTHFGIWPLSQAAEACFGTTRWPAERPVPQFSVEFDVATRRGRGSGWGRSCSRPATSCCMRRARSRGARR